MIENWNSADTVLFSNMSLSPEFSQVSRQCPLLPQGPTSCPYVSLVSSVCVCPSGPWLLKSTSQLFRGFPCLGFAWCFLVIRSRCLFGKNTAEGRRHPLTTRGCRVWIRLFPDDVDCVHFVQGYLPLSPPWSAVFLFEIKKCLVGILQDSGNVLFWWTSINNLYLSQLIQCLPGGDCLSPSSLHIS